MSARIYVATHKRYDYLLKIPYDYYVPIHCGKAVYSDSGGAVGFLPELGDNTGDNISNKNSWYCELTGLYWIWKNDKSEPGDIVGLNHYRRYFAEPDSDGMQFMSKETMFSWLQDSNFIVYGCGTDSDLTKQGDETAYLGYKQNHVIEDLDSVLVGIQKLFPNLYDSIYHELHFSGALCLCNMFITKKKYLDEYCSFLFPVLKYTEQLIDFDDIYHQGYNGRVFGFLGERLFRPWLIATKHSGKQGPGLDWEKYSGYIWK